MAKVLLHASNSESLKKIIYKFQDGILIKEFLGLNSASFDAGISGATMSLYLNKKGEKPRKIPASVEYSYSEKLKIK
jgi:hypothetical protein